MNADERAAWTRHVTQQPQTPKPSKYRNRKTTVDGIVFDSAKEAKRYQTLKMLEQAGKIRGLERQHPFALHVNGDCLGEWRADFVYFEEGAFIAEDVKGYRTDLYKWKRNHVRAQYRITIRET